MKLVFELIFTGKTFTVHLKNEEKQENLAWQIYNNGDCTIREYLYVIAKIYMH